MDKVQLSIIVPVYNMAADNKLTYCINSLLCQTITDYEIIAVNDASTDNSLEILQEYERQYPDKVRVITYSVNKRQGGAKNQGLKAARGEWIGFIDSDDWVTSDYYEKLLNCARHTGADMVGCDYSLVTEHTMIPGQVIQNNSLEQTGVLNKEKHGKLIIRSGSMVIKIYKHSVIQENHLCFPEGIFYEDNCAGSLWSVYFHQFEKVEEPLYFYYQHNTSTVHGISEERCNDRKKAAELLYQECVSRGILEKYQKELEYRFTELYYINTLFSYMLGMRLPRFSFIKELKEGQLNYFPNFQENSFYQKFTGEEEKQMIALQMKSDIKFFLLYRAKTIWRSVLKKIKKK